MYVYMKYCKVSANIKLVGEALSRFSRTLKRRLHFVKRNFVKRVPLILGSSRPRSAPYPCITLSTLLIRITRQYQRNETDDCDGIARIVRFPRKIVRSIGVIIFPGTPRAIVCSHVPVISARVYTVRFIGPVSGSKNHPPISKHTIKQKRFRAGYAELSSFSWGG